MTDNDGVPAINVNTATGTISGNTFQNIHQYGILLADKLGPLSITNNLFDNIINDTPGLSQNRGSGIRTFSTPTFAGPVTITMNTFSNSYHGARVANDGSPAAIGTGNLFVNRNSITGMTAARHLTCRRRRRGRSTARATGGAPRRTRHHRCRRRRRPRGHRRLDVACLQQPQRGVRRISNCADDHRGVRRTVARPFAHLRRSRVHAGNGRRGPAHDLHRDLRRHRRKPDRTPSRPNRLGIEHGSPILVGGLAAQGAYQCTVTATNAFGTSPASAPFFVFLGEPETASIPTAPAMLSTGPAAHVDHGYRREPVPVFWANGPRRLPVDLTRTGGSALDSGRADRPARCDRVRARAPR